MLSKKEVQTKLAQCNVEKNPGPVRVVVLASKDEDLLSDEDKPPDPSGVCPR